MKYLDWKNWRWVEFNGSRLGKALPSDCTRLVEKILKATQQDPLCVLCRYCECGHYDYVEGIGPVCVSCNGF